jgi:uncharacterized protein YegJ (DUF2314 family)
MCGIPGSWLLIVAVVALSIALRNYLQKKRTSREQPLISLVFLLRAPRNVTQADVVEAVNRAFGVNIDADVVVVPSKQANLFTVRTPEVILGIVSTARPYVSDIAEVAERVRDFRCKRAIQNHRAWLAVDDIGDSRAGDKHFAYCSIGKLLAELSGDDCLALYCTESGQMNSYAPDLLPLLRGPDPLSALTQPRADEIVSVHALDVDMDEAMAEARRRWPEFVAAFAKRRPLQGFAVKVPFRENDQTEHMWVEVSQLDGETIHGKLANEPKMIANLRLSDSVIVDLADVNDWIYSDGKQMIGGFTSAVLERRR